MVYIDSVKGIDPMTQTITHKIPFGVKTFRRSGKYIMPWSVAELNAAVKKYLQLGGFDARDDHRKFNEFCDAILKINPNRSEDSLYMIFFNIARCDKKVIQNHHYNLYGGAGNLLLKVLKKMDPNQVRFTQNPA
jgi:hypothetical protein